MLDYFLKGFQNEFADMRGRGLGNYAMNRPWGNYNPFQKKFWSEEGQKSYAKNALQNFVDPGRIFGGLFGSDDKKEDENMIAGQTPEYWAEKLGLSDKEKADMIARLTRGIGTQTAQAANRSDEISAMENAPQATRDARQRGIAQQGNQAVVAGTENIEQLDKSMDRSAWGTIMGGLAGKENAQMNAALQQSMYDKQMAYNNFLPMFQMLGQMIGGNMGGNNQQQGYNNYRFNDPNQQNNYGTDYMLGGGQTTW